MMIDTRRERQDWVRCDVHCLMCGRLLSRLLGNRMTDQTISFVAVRPIDPPGPVVAWSAPRQFRCLTCSGMGIVDDMDVFSTCAEVEAQDEPTVRTGAGRPTRPFHPIARRTPLELALAKL